MADFSGSTYIWTKPAGPAPPGPTLPKLSVLDRRIMIPSLDATPDKVLYATQGGEDDTREERGSRCFWLDQPAGKCGTATAGAGTGGLRVGHGPLVRFT